MGKNKLKIFLQWLALVLLVGILAYTVWGITEDVAVLSHAGFHPTHRERFFGRPGSTGAQAPSQIQSWMTLRYVNFVFHLDPNYLKTSLGITDSHYPNISINALAKEQKITAGSELLLVQQAVNARPIPEAPKVP